MSLQAPVPKEKISGSQAARRRNTSKACEECRRRRAKCDGQKPSCSRCATRAIDCRYAEEPDGRRPASKSYVDLLRSRIENLERTLQANGIDVDSSGAQLEAKEKQQSDVGSHDIRPIIDSLTSEVLCADFEGALTLEESLNFDQDGEIRYFGPASGRLEFRSEQAKAIETYESAEKRTSNKHGSLHEKSRRVFHTSMIDMAEEETREELKNHLLDLYFKWEQPWCWVVNETIFRESERSNGRYHSPLLLNCMLAIGSRYSDRLEVRSDPEDPNTAGEPFISKAEALLPVDLKWPSITTIQSLSVLGTIYIAIGCDAAGWLYQGMANRLALDMGLNLDASSLKGASMLSVQEVILRRQIYWALYCVDKLSASYTGRVCTMLDCQGIVEMPQPSPLNHNYPSESDEYVKFRCATIRTCRILEKILTNLYSPKPSLPRSKREAFLEEVLLELRTWLYDLPSEFRIDRAAQPNTLPQAYILQMVYNTSLILLTKPFINAQNTKHTEKIPQQYGDTISKRARAKCYESAREICIIARKYQHAFGNFRQSPLSGTHCTLSAAVILLQAMKSDSDGRKRMLDHNLDRCLQVLDELSISWSPARKIYNNLVTMYSPRAIATKKHGGDSNPNDVGTGASGNESRLHEEHMNTVDAVPSSDHDGLENSDLGVEELMDQDLESINMEYDWDTGIIDQSFGFDFMFDTLPSDYESFDSLQRNQFDERW